MNRISNYLSAQGIVPFAASWKLLDTRPEGLYRTLHLVGAVSLPVPGIHLNSELLEKYLPSILLPARHEPLLVMVESEARGDAINQFFKGRGRDQTYTIVLSEDMLQSLPASILAHGSEKNHLWSAPQYLVDNFSFLPPPVAGPVLDLGCGSGRAMVWLAERGYQVTGIDRQPEALSLGEELAARRGVSCRFLKGDLRHAQCIGEGPWSVILNFRFLQRELLQTLVTRLLQPGGVGIIRTFRDYPGYQGHPAPIHRLARGELLEYFPVGLCDVLAHEENFDADNRPAAGIVVRRFTQSA